MYGDKDYSGGQKSYYNYTSYDDEDSDHEKDNQYTYNDEGIE
jgi:hypothetical protein